MALLGIPRSMSVSASFSPRARFGVVVMRRLRSLACSQSLEIEWPDSCVLFGSVRLELARTADGEIPRNLPCRVAALGTSLTRIYGPVSESSQFWKTHVSFSFHVREHLRPEIRQDYPLNLSILISGGKETNKDSPSNGE